jgi:polysaccharide biosynthesis transport protein
VQFLGLDRKLRVIQVTSSLPGEGKTTTATNLAVVLAQAGHEVAIVDADLRKPRIHEVFSVPTRPGLTDTLVASDPVDMAINHLGRLHVVCAGTMAANPSEMMGSARFSALITDLAQRYDFVVLDSPPALPVADAVALSRAVDGVLMVSQANRTSKRALAEGLARLEQVGAAVVGIVLNRASEGSSRGYGYGYGYEYTAEPAHSPAPPPPPPPARAVPPPPEQAAARRGPVGEPL